MEPNDQRLARRFGALSREGRRGFLAKLRQAGLSFAELPILPAARSGKLPLSYAQRGLWLTWKLDPDSPAYNMAGILRFRGRLDVGALLASVQNLIERHETLRTIFHVDDDDEPHQVILPPNVIKTEEVDLSDLPEQERTQEVHRLQQDLARAPFRLDAEPPLRTRLWTLGDDEHVLGIVLHHIAGDGASVRILVDELLFLYQYECGLHTERLEPLPIQFADYVVWQRNWFEVGEKARQLAYWQARLGGEHPPLDLPVTRPRGVSQSRKEGHYKFGLPADLSDGLRLLARDHGASLFMVMLALFKLLLCHYSGQTDVRIGAPIANRQRLETRGMIAYLTNMLVLHTRVDLSGTFSDLIGAVRETVLEAHAHPDLPFDLLVEALQPERHAGVHPLFQVKCTQHDATPTVWSLPGMEIEIDGLSAGDAHFELSLDFLDRSDHIEVVFVYSKDLFDEAAIARFARVFSALVGYVAKSPGAPLNLADIGEPLAHLEGESRSFIHTDVLDLWNDSVRRFPDRNAVRCDDRAYSYAELDIHADQLSAELMAYGVGPETRVGVHAERSCEFALGVLAALKAGAAYVPLDPQLPPQRLAYQAADSGVQVLLTTEAPAWEVSVPLIELAFGATSRRKVPPQIKPHPAQAAYVIYTSGSTGQPKGVVISRGALANYVQAVLERADLSADASEVAMVSTVAADLGHTSFFGALCSGRTLHLIPTERVFDPDAFAEYMNRHRVGVLKIVPSHLQALLNAGTPADVLPACRLVLGGEAAPWPLLERIAALKPGCRVLNHYGPTETTVGILTQEAGEALLTADTLPVGRPIANCNSYVLDADLNLVPTGVAGELYLGGATMARGYQARAAQSAERFVANPFEAGARLYRTGDRVRMLEDGSLEFLGRVDDQVKVRGYRVELREVARALLEQPGISEAEVIAREKEDGYFQLHGYVVVRAGERVDLGGLREALARTLPEYMVPLAVMQLDALPLTANGKLDRRKLPLPDVEAGRHSDDAPRGDLEETLVGIWKDVLCVERVGRHDNFFTIGGDSILALKVTARARKSGLSLTPRQLFESRTLVELAQSMGRGAGTKPEVPEAYVRLNSGNETFRVFFIHDGWGSILDYTNIARFLGDIGSAVGIPCRHVNGAEGPRNLLDLAKQHARVIKELQPRGPYRICGWSLGGAIAPLVAGLLEDAGESVDFVGAIDPYVQHQGGAGVISLMDDIKRFFSILIPERLHQELLNDSAVRDQLAETSGRSDSVGRLIDLVTSRVDREQLHEYGALTSEELAAMFLAARSLGTIAGVPFTPIPIQAPIVTWWSSERSEAEKSRFSSWLGLRIQGDFGIDANHLEIVRMPEVAMELTRRLQSLC
ncbi:MAG: amino acid adenylation domain-containing protein [Rhodocyclaceae bacterium]